MYAKIMLAMGLFGASYGGFSQSIEANIKAYLEQGRNDAASLLMKGGKRFEDLSSLEKATLLADRYPHLALQFLKTPQPESNLVDSVITTGQIIANLPMNTKNNKSALKDLKRLHDRDLNRAQRLKKYKLLIEISNKQSNWQDVNKFSRAYLRKFRYHELDESTLITSVKGLTTTKQNRTAHTILEKMARFHPSTAGSEWAFNYLYRLSQEKDRIGMRKYYFPTKMLRQINRYSHLKQGLRETILSILDGPVKVSRNQIRVLEGIAKVRALNYLRETDLALDHTMRMLQENSHSGQQKELLWLAAKFNMKKQNFQVAENYINKYISPENGKREKVWINRNLAKIKTSNQELRDAAKHFEIVATNTNRPKDRWNYFWSLYRGKQYNKALSLYNKPRYIVRRDFTRSNNGKKYWLSRLLEANNQNRAAKTLRAEILADKANSFYSLVIQEKYPNEWLSQSIVKANTSEKRLVASSGNDWSQYINTTKDPRVKRYPLKFDDITSKVSTLSGVEKFLILSIMKAESSFDASVISPVGARGLMQMMPATADRVTKKIAIDGIRSEDLNTPKVAITLGGYYLKYLLDLYDGHYIPAIAAYNAGPKKVNEWLKACGKCSADEFVESIPYKETRFYTKKVFKFIKNYRSIYEPLNQNKIISRKLPSIPDSSEDLF